MIKKSKFRHRLIYEKITLTKKKNRHFFWTILTAIAKIIVKITTRFEIRDLINNIDQIKLLKYKNFVNVVFSENITIYQFKYFFTNEKIEHVDIIKKKSIKLSIKYQNYVDIFNKKKNDCLNTIELITL